MTHTTTLFAPRLPEEYAVWMGRIKSLEEFKDTYKVDAVKYADELEAFLAEDGAPAPLLLLEGNNSDSGSKYVAPTLPTPFPTEPDITTLFPVLANNRVYKTDEELKLMKVSSFIRKVVSVRNVLPSSSPPYIL